MIHVYLCLCRHSLWIFCSFQVCLKKGLTNRVVPGSCLCQHVQEGGVVGKSRYIQWHQALITHPVYSLLPVSLPVLFLLLSSLPHASYSSASTSTDGVVSGQQALYGQRVLIFHRFPQGLVLMVSKKVRKCVGEQAREGGKEGGRTAEVEGSQRKKKVHSIRGRRHADDWQRLRACLVV